ncbi:hypothetical protein ElyMa_000684700 [Elysia marginata]|uniref:Uncharacterized protein n=1 Tax=Elysia marginata TaxID=1093978 RepID=A0AAV4GGU2_9GAST|nr:hypothetical protein ElyMa_000684700 [Elysia marginata]
MDNLRCFLKADKTCKWNLHLVTQHEMLPFLAATDHYLYTKSDNLYFKVKLQLQTIDRNKFDSFQTETEHFLQTSYGKSFPPTDMSKLLSSGEMQFFRKGGALPQEIPRASVFMHVPAIKNTWAIFDSRSEARLSSLLDTDQVHS